MLNNDRVDVCPLPLLPSWMACLIARDLHRLDSGGQTAIFAGSLQLFCFPEDDTGMRNIAVAVLRQLGFPGTASPR